MACNTLGSTVSMLYRLGWLVRKLSLEETLSTSKKNSVVTSFLSWFTHVRRQPFTIKNIVLEISPSRKRTVLAGTSTRLECGANTSQFFSLNVSCFMLAVAFVG